MWYSFLKTICPLNYDKILVSYLYYFELTINTFNVYNLIINNKFTIYLLLLIIHYLLLFIRLKIKMKQNTM